MGLNHSPTIVKNGLVLYLDAANPKSYPGSGSVWNDLSGNAKTATLFNSPTFGNSNAGTFNFDGSNDYGRVIDLTISSLKNGFTWGGWITHTNILAGWGWICGGSNLSAGQSYSWFQIGKKSGNGGIRFETGAFYSNTALDADVNIADGKWHYVLGLVDLITNIKAIYVDGLLVASTPISISNTNLDYGSLTFGTQMRSNSSLQEFWIGKISNIQVYTRALSAAEIRQNFNATRGRFGI